MHSIHDSPVIKGTFFGLFEIALTKFSCLHTVVEFKKCNQNLLIAPTAAKVNELDHFHHNGYGEWGKGHLNFSPMY